jgi:hypothetical protein
VKINEFRGLPGAPRPAQETETGSEAGTRSAASQAGEP